MEICLKYKPDLLLVIRYSLLVTRYLLFIIRYSLLVAA